jgi:hypothetical protein
MDTSFLIGCEVSMVLRFEIEDIPYTLQHTLSVMCCALVTPFQLFVHQQKSTFNKLMRNPVAQILVFEFPAQSLIQSNFKFQIAFLSCFFIFQHLMLLSRATLQVSTNCCTIHTLLKGDGKV